MKEIDRWPYLLRGKEKKIFKREKNQIHLYAKMYMDDRRNKFNLL